MSGVPNPATGQLYSPQPASRITAEGDGEYAMITPESNLDLNGDGTPDGYRGLNALPDGAEFTAVGTTTKYVVKAVEMLDVPKLDAVSACSTLTLKKASPDPIGLNCGPRPANYQDASPTFPTALTWNHGVKNRL